MKTTFLLPNYCKKIGWALLLITSIAGAITAIRGEQWSLLHHKVLAIVGSDFQHNTKIFTMVEANLTYTLTGALFILGALLVAFSKEKQEDEFIAHLRLIAFQWSVLVNYVILLLVFLGVYGIDFLLVLSYNLYTVIVLFIIRFHYLLVTNRENDTNEK